VGRERLGGGEVLRRWMGFIFSESGGELMEYVCILVLW